MSEKYIQVASFKFGLDQRRQELVSQPGELEVLQNAYVNSGGEIVKRKAFVLDGTPFPPNTFGLQDTDEGLMTFGSDASPSASLPTGVVYQRLLPNFLATGQPTETLSLAGTASVNGVYTQNGVSGGKPYYTASGGRYIMWFPGYPGAGGGAWLIGDASSTYYYSFEDKDRPDQVVTWSILGGVAPVPTIVFAATSTLAQMVSVIFSCNFLGKAFVIAQFGDTLTGTYQFTFCFYDGELVEASRNGLVLLDGSGNVEDVSDLADDLAAQINEITGWAATANVDENGSPFAGAVIIRSPAGIHFTPSDIDIDSSAGNLGAVLISQGGTGTAQVAPYASFTLATLGIVNPSTITLTAPTTDPDDGNVAQLTGGAIAYATSLSDLATAVAAAVNARTFITGYTAVANGATLTITAPLSFGATSAAVHVVTTGELETTAGGATTGNFTLAINPAGIVSIQQGDPSTHTFDELPDVIASVSNVSAAVNASLTTVVNEFTIPALDQDVTNVNVADATNIAVDQILIFKSGAVKYAILKVTGKAVNVLTLRNIGFRGTSANSYFAGTKVDANATVSRDFVWVECNADGTFPRLLPLSGIVINTQVGGTVRFNQTEIHDFVDRPGPQQATIFQGYFRCYAQSPGATPAVATQLMTVALSYKQLPDN